MKSRVTFPLAVAAMLLIAALSTGSPVLLLPAVLVLLTVGMSWLSVRLAARTLRVEAKVAPDSVQRGQDAVLKIRVKYSAPLPVAPLVMEMPDEDGGEPRRVIMPGNGVSGAMELTIHTAHVGVIRSGVRDCIIEDLFGMFSVTRQPQVEMNELLVLPQTFQVEELIYAPGDSGMETLARATEDISNPSDLRSYAPGDPMKKIHWKQSLRKQELLVRRFEEPAMPEALVLMDCSPIRADDPELAADLQDALLETAASLLSMPHEGHTIRMPLLGEHPMQLHSSMGLPHLLESLARADFSQTDRFERVLMLEGRRMGQVGSLVIVTARLSGAVVQAITSLNRMCPAIRVYLITDDPKSERNLRYVNRLHHAAIQVSYVTPLKA